MTLLRAAAWAAFFLGVACWLLTPVRARDVWMHLACGRYIHAAGAMPRTDVFSSTCAGRPWIDHEWLYQTGLYALYQKVGVVEAAEGVKIVLILLAFLALAIRLNSLGIPASLNILSCGAIFWICRPGWTERADLISVAALSFIFLSLELNLSWLWPIAFCVWANMHGGFVLGLAILGLYSVGAVIDRPAQWRRLSVITGLCALATLINPYGVHLHQSLIEGLRYLGSARISEWQATPWAPMKAFWIILLLTWGLFLYKALRTTLLRQPMTPSALGALPSAALLSWMAVRHVRNVPYFMIGIFPLALAHLKDLLPARAWSGKSPALIGVLAGALLFARAGYARRAIGVQSGVIPEAACSYILDHHLPAPYYNDYAFGSYWLWRLAPERPVFIDGRLHTVDGYPALYELTERSKKTPRQWTSFLAERRIRTALIEKSDPALKLLLAHYFPAPEWRCVYEDGYSLLYSR